MRHIMLTYVPMDASARDMDALRARPRRCLHREYVPVPVQTPFKIADLMALAERVWGEHARRAAAFDPRVATHGEISAVWAGPRGRRIVPPLTGEDVLLVDELALSHDTRPRALSADEVFIEMTTRRPAE